MGSLTIERVTPKTTKTGKAYAKRGPKPGPRATYTCPMCGKQFQRRLWIRYKRPPFCSQTCAKRHHWTGSGNPKFNNGITIRRDGYVFRYLPNHPDALSAGYILEHRLIMEQKLGRRLLASEVVHHLDNNPSNNDPGNLALLNGQSEHTKIHTRGPHGYFIKVKR